MNIAKRVGALESQAGVGNYEAVHRIFQRAGQARDEAIDLYGRDRIGPRDFVILRVVISPRFDAAGNMIFFKDWPENRLASPKSSVSGS